MIIRRANIHDLKAIVEIYNQAILTGKSTADLTPVTPNSRVEWFNQHTPDRYPIFIAETENIVAGWISLSPYRSGREALRFTAEVSFYIHTDYQRKGIGTKLLDLIIAEIPKIGIKTIFAIILEHNYPSINLVEKFKFEKWGFLPKVADFMGNEVGHLYYGFRVAR